MEMTKRVSAKDVWLQNGKIALFGALALLLVLLLMIELFSGTDGALEVKEQIRISASSLSGAEEEEKEYLCQLSGVLINSSDEGIRIDHVTVAVSDGEIRKGLVLEGFYLPARTEQAIAGSLTGATEYNRVTDVYVTVNGEEIRLTNESLGEQSLGWVPVLYLVLLAGVALLIVRACKIRYYLHQETLLK